MLPGMHPKDADREKVLHLLEEAGGLTPQAVAKVSRETGINAEADALAAYERLQQSGQIKLDE